MALAKYNRSVTDAAGNLILDPVVRVRRMALGMPRPPLFSDPDGLVQISNPATFSEGLIGFHVAGGFYEIRVTSPTHPGFERILEWEAIGNLAAMDFGESGLLSFDWDAVVPLIAGREAYDAQVAGFSVLVESDAGHDNLPTVYYKKSIVGGDVPGATGTPIGNMTGGGALAAAFNGTTVQAIAAAATLSNSASDGTVGKDWGVGNSKVISKATLYGPSDAAIARNTANANTSVNAKLQGSQNGSDWTDLNTQATGTSTAALITFTPVSTTAYRYHRILIPAADSSSDKHAAEVLFHQAGDWSSGLIFPAIRLKAALSFNLDADDNIIQAGTVWTQPVPFPGQIAKWVVTSKGTGSIVIDIRQTPFADWPTEVGDSITGGNPITLTASNKASDAVLSGWNKALVEGRMLDFVVVSCDGLTDATITLFTSRT